MSKNVFNDNKCKYEAYDKSEVNGLLANKANLTDVYNKSQINNLLNNKANTNEVYVKGDFAILTGTLNVSGDMVYLSGIQYPEGFTQNNCIVISAMLQTTSATPAIWYYDGGFSPRTLAVQLRTASISTQAQLFTYADGVITPESFAAGTYTYKIVLMKIS